MKKIGKVSPYLFGDHLVIAISNEWVRVFGRIPRFEVIFDDKSRLVIQSESVNKNKGDVTNEYQ